MSPREEGREFSKGKRRSFPFSFITHTMGRGKAYESTTYLDNYHGMWKTICAKEKKKNIFTSYVCGIGEASLGHQGLIHV